MDCMGPWIYTILVFCQNQSFGPNSISHASHHQNLATCQGLWKLMTQKSCAKSLTNKEMEVGTAGHKAVWTDIDDIGKCEYVLKTA